MNNNPLKRVTHTINTPGSPLHGAKVRLIRMQRTGRPLVAMLEQRGAYKEGDKVQLGTGELTIHIG